MMGGKIWFLTIGNMKTREEIMSEVLFLNREIEEKQEEINKLYKEAKAIDDKDDDESKFSYISAIKSYVS